MAEKMSFFFDKDADVLYITVGKKQAAISREIGNDMLIRIVPKNNKVIGFTIMNFTARFKKMKQPEVLPLNAIMTLPYMDRRYNGKVSAYMKH